jgi:hypothetical protein
MLRGLRLFGAARNPPPRRVLAPGNDPTGRGGCARDHDRWRDPRLGYCHAWVAAASCAAARDGSVATKSNRPDSPTNPVKLTFLSAISV